MKTFRTPIFAASLLVLFFGCQAPHQREQQARQYRDVSWIVPYSPEGTIRIHAQASFSDDEAGIEVEYPFLEVRRQRVGWTVYLWTAPETKYTLATYLRRDRAIRFSEKLAKQLSRPKTLDSVASRAVQRILVKR